jgi:hypothetical protein
MDNKLEMSLTAAIISIPLWLPETNNINVIFEVFTAVTMKNTVFWDEPPCGSCKNRCFGGT